jgi:hypothetical protein
MGIAGNDSTSVPPDPLDLCQSANISQVRGFAKGPQDEHSPLLLSDTGQPQ